MNNKISLPPKFLIDRYKNWKSNEYSKNEVQLRKLASSGQSPSTMVISCCDSRIHATSIFGADEGEFFIHRNIANLVPQYSPDGENHGTSAAIEYAIKELKVQHLIILGHKDCGGIKNGYHIHSNSANPKYEFINKWLSILLPAYNKIQKDISERKQINQLEQESIKVSINNLFSFPFIKNAIDENNLSIHGLIHDIGSGNLKFLNPVTQNFENF
jgi:carbonic anhydrase